MLLPILFIALALVIFLIGVAVRYITQYRKYRWHQKRQYYFDKPTLKDSIEHAFNYYTTTPVAVILIIGTVIISAVALIYVPIDTYTIKVNWDYKIQSIEERAAILETEDTIEKWYLNKEIKEFNEELYHQKTYEHNIWYGGFMANFGDEYEYLEYIK